jgi:hypothetical protein
MDHFSFSVFRVFSPDFSSVSLEEFSLIPSMDLGARRSLIIYLQPLSESMALAHLISWISPRSPKT